MFKFGSKAWLPSVAELVLVQTTNILIAASMGPAPLAVFSRSRNLVKYARDLVVRMAAVLVASVSSLQAAGEDEKIRDLIIKATRYAAFLTLPVTVLLAILGEPLLHVWMGARYADGPLLAVLAVGYFGSTLQLPVMAILSGMNRHGRLAAANMIGSAIATAAVAVVLLWMNLGLTSSAIAATLPLAVINLVYAPLHIRHRTGLSLTKYFREAFWFPLICMVPFALCLAIARWVFPANPMLAFAGGGVAGGLILVPIYWRYVIPGSLKAALIRKLTPASKALPPAVTSPPTGAG
jgi:O-antigen/teichoic acid export membrane protein